MGYYSARDRMIGKIYRSKGTMEPEHWEHIIVYQSGNDWQSRDVNGYNLMACESEKWWEEHYKEVGIKDIGYNVGEYLGHFSRDTEYEFFDVNYGDRETTILKNIEEYYKV